MNVGDIINYEIQVLNNSLNSVENIIVSDTLSNLANSFKLETTFKEEINVTTPKIQIYILSQKEILQTQIITPLDFQPERI